MWRRAAHVGALLGVALLLGGGLTGCTYYEHHDHGRGRGHYDRRPRERVIIIDDDDHRHHRDYDRHDRYYYDRHDKRKAKGGPPPWAPAHGYRRKHHKHH